MAAADFVNLAGNGPYLDAVQARQLSPDMADTPLWMVRSLHRHAAERDKALQGVEPEAARERHRAELNRWKAHIGLGYFAHD